MRLEFASGLCSGLSVEIDQKCSKDEFMVGLIGNSDLLRGRSKQNFPKLDYEQVTHLCSFCESKGELSVRKKKLT